MKNSLTKKLILSILSIAFAVVSLGTTTFAWFTLSSTADVAPFEGTVKAGEGFEVAITKVGVAPTVWYTNQVPASAVKKVIDECGFDTFDAVTITSTENPLTSVKRLEVVEGALVLNDVSQENAITNLISFDLHFRLASVSATEYNINLSTLNLETSGQVKWTVDQTYKIDDSTTQTVGTELTYDVASAARVGFFGTITKVYEEEAGAKSEGMVANTTGVSATNGAIDYFVKKHGLKADVTIPEPFNINAVVLGDTTNTIATVKGADVAKTTVAVWLEGWDAECMNPIFAQTLKATMKFVIVAK